METLFVLLVILAITRAAGEIAERMVGSALVGELIGGIGLGIGFSAFGIWLARNGITDFVTGQGALSCGGLVAEDDIRAIADLGMFFLMLLAGMKMHPSELGQASKRGVFIGLGGLIVPFVLGLLLATLFLPSSPKLLEQTVFIGTALSITAVPIAVKILLERYNGEYERVRHRYGQEPKANHQEPHGTPRALPRGRMPRRGQSKPRLAPKMGGISCNPLPRSKRLSTRAELETHSKTIRQANS